MLVVRGHPFTSICSLSWLTKVFLADEDCLVLTLDTVLLPFLLSQVSSTHT
jgi:hypothetical protein|eukprot:SAG25_NODE_636_length_6268_cov_2.205997_3_plen_51_part_00